MKKYMVLCILVLQVLFLFACIQNTLPPELPSCEELEQSFIDEVNSITTQRIHSTVRIQFYDPVTEITHTAGSGIIYKLLSNHFLILTNNHILDDYQEGMDLRMLDAQGFYTQNGEIIYRDQDLDLAIIKIRQVISPNNIARPAPLAEASAEIGEYIINIGAINLQMNAVLMGQVIRYDYVELPNFSPSYLMMITNHDVKGGLSGSGVFNAHGQIIGIVLGYQFSDETIIIPLSVIMAFIDAFESSEAYQ